MEDSQIIELYWQRDERAISETHVKYGRYCHTIAFNVLHNEEDTEEVVNDTYIGAWNAIPPEKPDILQAFLAKITRNLSLKKYRDKTAQKRGGTDNTNVALDELEECLASHNSVEDEIEGKELAKIINRYVETLSEDERRVFICRYFYFDSVAEIADRFGFTQSKVKMILKRTRDRLKIKLEEEEIWV